MLTVEKWPNGSSSQSVAQLRLCTKTMKLTGTGGQTDGQTGGQDHILNQADALTKNRVYNNCFVNID